MQLVRACAGSDAGSKKDDREAWEEFIRRFHPVIASAVLRTARQWDEPARALIDDLIQEAYLKLCENDYRLLRGFQPVHENSIYKFLKVVASNVVRDYFKAKNAIKRGEGQTEPITEAMLQSLPADMEKASGTEWDAVSQRIELDKIDRVLRELTGKESARNRIIFWLRHRQGLTAAEIACIPSFGLTTEGVESVLMRLAAVISKHQGYSPED
jgi:RNA polymerase sigma-70 factor (ECF subfamily)